MNGLLIGRFQPFHFGHLEAIHFGLSKVDTLFIGIGSSNKSHQERNPFTADERKEMMLFFQMMILLMSFLENVGKKLFQLNSKTARIFLVRILDR